MAIIGFFQATQNGYEGTLETLALKAKISIESANKNNDKAPDYRVFQVTEHFKSEIGAAWTKTSREGAQYLSLNIDDISFATKAYCRLVKTGAEKGPHALLGTSAPQLRARVSLMGRSSDRPNLIPSTHPTGKSHDQMQLHPARHQRHRPRKPLSGRTLRP